MRDAIPAEVLFRFRVPYTRQVKWFSRPSYPGGDLLAVANGLTPSGDQEAL